MLRFKKILKWFILSALVLVFTFIGFGYWFLGLIPKSNPEHELSTTVPQSLTYLTENRIAGRGKILTVVTSIDKMGDTDKPTGYELTELSRAYYVFEANGFEVDIASPKGGKPPVIIDDEDMAEFDFAFLNDSVAQRKATNTIPLAEVDHTRYSAIYFVGGKGAMFDFPENPHIQHIIGKMYQDGKVIGAVCHGPAALVNVTLDDGRALLKDRSVSSFTNEEELFLIPNAEEIFPFLLENKLVEKGARFKDGAMYLQHVVHDDQLITGQNPWSTWKLAETMITQMGYEPKARVLTPEENAMLVLSSYDRLGHGAAKNLITEMTSNALEMNRTLLAMHSIVAAMQWNFGKSIQLISLTSHAKNQTSAST